MGTAQAVHMEQPLLTSNMMKETTYYDATRENLKDTERQLALKYRPGKNGSEGEVCEQTSQAHRVPRG